MHTLHFSGPGSEVEVAVTVVGKFKVDPAAVLGAKVNVVAGQEVEALSLGKTSNCSRGAGWQPRAPRGCPWRLAAGNLASHGETLPEEGATHPGAPHG